MFLEVVETQLDTASYFTEGFFFHIETHGVMMVAFCLCFHIFEVKIFVNRFRFN
jgi:hypothetical protein